MCIYVYAINIMLKLYGTTQHLYNIIYLYGGELNFLHM